MIIDVDKISTDKFNELKDRLDQATKYLYSSSLLVGMDIKLFTSSLKQSQMLITSRNNNCLHYAEMFEKEYDVETDSSTSRCFSCLLF